MSMPIDILIPGCPVSYQSKGPALRDWKRKVMSAARAAVAHPNVDDEMAVCVTHFYRRRPRFDADNMAKPICDALINIVYDDDRQISERVARRLPLYRAFELQGMPPDLALALCAGKEFVFIRATRIRTLSLSAVFEQPAAACVW